MRVSYRSTDVITLGLLIGAKSQKVERLFSQPCVSSPMDTKFLDSKRKGLGEEFEDELNKYFYLILNTKYFQIRYDEVRCLPLKIFAYMIHYSVDEANRQIIVRAVFNTHRDPNIWKRNS